MMLKDLIKHLKDFLKDHPSASVYVQDESPAGPQEVNGMEIDEEGDLVLYV